MFDSVVLSPSRRVGFAASLVASAVLVAGSAHAQPAAPAAPATPGDAAAPTGPAPSGDASAPPAAATPSADETAARLDALAAEVRRLKLEVAAPETELRSHVGMGPAASKVYFSPRGLAIGGYGEIVYENYIDQPTKKDRSDLLRAILYTGYRFSDRILFNAELEFEHAHTGKKGAVEVEFAYLDFVVTPYLTVRAGNVLVPIGFINEMHEPATFAGVLRPDLERNIIPTTWNENGVGVYGQAGPVRFKAYLMNGLQAFSDQKCATDANKNTVCDRGNRGFTSSSWIREGRQRGSEAVTEDFAGVLNVAVTPIDALVVGGTTYFGQSGQGTKVEDTEVEGNVWLSELHVGFTHRGFEARAIGALGTLSGARRISSKQGQVIASRVAGGYAEVGYDVLRLLAPESSAAVSPFVRFEALELADRVPSGMTANPSLSSTNLTAGVTYRPLSTLAVKADVQRRTTGADTNNVLDQFNLGVGYAF